MLVDPHAASSQMSSAGAVLARCCSQAATWVHIDVDNNNDDEVDDDDLDENDGDGDGDEGDGDELCRCLPGAAPRQQPGFNADLFFEGR